MGANESSFENLIHSVESGAGSVPWSALATVTHSQVFEYCQMHEWLQLAHTSKQNHSTARLAEARLSRTVVTGGTTWVLSSVAPTPFLATLMRTRMHLNIVVRAGFAPTSAALRVLEDVVRHSRLPEALTFSYARQLRSVRVYDEYVRGENRLTRLLRTTLEPLVRTSPYGIAALRGPWRRLFGVNLGEVVAEAPNTAQRLHCLLDRVKSVCTLEWKTQRLPIESRAIVLAALAPRLHTMLLAQAFGDATSTDPWAYCLQLRVLRLHMKMGNACAMLASIGKSLPFLEELCVAATKAKVAHIRVLHATLCTFLLERDLHRLCLHIDTNTMQERFQLRHWWRATSKADWQHGWLAERRPQLLVIEIDGQIVR